MAASPDIGVLFVFAVAGLAVYGVVLGGWSSGSKFSFLGALRACAQMLSYEVPMALAVMTVLVTLGTLRLDIVVAEQARYFDSTAGIIPHWNCFTHPIACLIFITCIFAECNRTPFDLAECESELVGGYHTEYSSMKFAMFFLGEYASMITGSAVAVALFFGGWHLPWLDHAIYGGTSQYIAADGSTIWVSQPVATGFAGVLLKFGIFWAKVIAFLAFYMAIRWTLPRFRFDQLMALAWRGMIPLSLGAFLISSTVVYLKVAYNLNHPSLWLLVGNVGFLIVTLVVLSKMPKGDHNRRVPVPGSRYNPELAAAKAAALDA
jgi:NADH-quinone oxidoreductase subunit H